MKKGLRIAVGLIAIIAVWLFLQFAAPVLYITRTLEFKTCSVRYSYYPLGKRKMFEGHYVTNRDEFYYANRKLALCLCESYLKNPVADIKVKILELGRSYSSHPSSDLDSILINRKTWFDPVMYIE